jgi:hypothetical protein
MFILPFISLSFFPLVIIIVIFMIAGYKESSINQENSTMVLKKVYLYSVSIISLGVLMIGAIIFVYQLLALLFVQNTSGYSNNEFQSTMPIALSMIIVGAPVWYYHWRMARREV